MICIMVAGFLAVAIISLLALEVLSGDNKKDGGDDEQ